MRATFLLFLSLCFFLLTGSQYSYSHTNAQDTHKPDEKIIITHSSSKTVAPAFFLHKNKTLTEIKEDFINIEDDDEEFVIARKHIELINYFVTLAYASILVHFYNYLKNCLPFCKHLSYKSSYKYILQRVLRI
ncbi:hypothetical protein [Pedobacter sp. JCM 36344]|uniref:hypothetical protein n=1 Tax=Pedobacter sp. JCM 36344 TaxID=3374280 RepID=UPI00397A0A73